MTRFEFGKNGDPLLDVIAELHRLAGHYTEVDPDMEKVGILNHVIGLLEEALAFVDEYPVRDELIEAITGFDLGSIRNQKVRNVGRRNASARRLGDLPLRPGHKSVGRKITALRQAKKLGSRVQLTARERRAIVRAQQEDRV